jgi:hypothetical protein
MNTTLRQKISQYWTTIQEELILQVTEELGPLTNQMMAVVRTLEMARIEEFVDRRWCGIGRPPKDRCALSRAFMAKAILKLPTTEALRERLQMDRQLQRICGFDTRKALPDAATFSRAFVEMAEGRVGERCHATLIEATLGDQLILHIARDGTAIHARERPKCDRKNKRKGKVIDLTKVRPAQATLIKPATTINASTETIAAPRSDPTVTKHGRGRPKKGEVRIATPAAPTRLQQQRSQTLQEMLTALPRQCDRGTKCNAQGYKNSWNGYKLNWDIADGGIPISVVLTNASVHDSQTAIPLATMSAQRVTNLYDVMDAAFCSIEIREHSIELGHVPLIDHNPRGGEKREFDPAEMTRYKVRTQSERANARLKDEFGANNVFVRGGEKVMAHLMFGVLALTVDQLWRLVT